MRTITLLGDCRDWLANLPDNRAHSIVTDPPYGLSFMGKAWDYDVPGVDVWREALRVLRPGGHLLAFFGTRTYHRGVVAIEDAGFEIRDQVGWLYGSGFPKSHNIGEGRGTALKPAQEPIVLARKPLVGTVAENVSEWGAGALNVDRCRIEVAAIEPNARKAKQGKVSPGYEEGFAGTERTWGGANGRWPANIIHDGSDEVLAVLPDRKVNQPSARGLQTGISSFREGGNKLNSTSPFYGDTGSAARFFYCAKASRSERGPDNKHPTVKPIALMRYLCRLVTPPGGVVLDPFMGSGTTGIAARLEGFEFIGIERDPNYFTLAESRINEAVPA